MIIFKLSLFNSKKEELYLQLKKIINTPSLFATVFMVFFTLDSVAQYTNVINSNRPGFSESPYSVGIGIYQLETSFYLKRGEIAPTFSIPDYTGLNLLFRTSFFLEKLEFNLHASYQNDKVAFKNIFTSHYHTHGLSELTIGTKYLIYEPEYIDNPKKVRGWVSRQKFDWKKLIPSVGIYGGFNINQLNDIHKASSSSPKFGILLQNDISNYFNVISNFYYDKIGTQAPEFSYIISATYSFTPRWSTFFENKSTFNNLRTSSNLGSGIAYLYNKNLQFNTSLRFVSVGESKGVYASVGVSLRIDRHVDKYYILDINEDEFEEEK